MSSSQGSITLTGASVTAGQIAAGTSVQAKAQSGALQLGPVTATSYINLMATDGFITAPSLNAEGPINVATLVSTLADPGGAFVDIGSAASGSAIKLTAAGGYASLTNASFSGPGDALSVTTPERREHLSRLRPGRDEPSRPARGRSPARRPWS